MTRSAPGAAVLAALLAAAACSDADGEPEGDARVCMPCPDTPDAGGPLAPADAGAEAGDAAAQCCIRRCGHGDPALTHGPLLGAVDDQGVKLWARSSGPEALSVIHWSADEGGPSEHTPGPALEGATDFTGVAELTGHAATSEHEYRLLFENAACAPEPLPVQRFTTLPPAGSPSPLRFVFGADIFFTDLPVFDEVVALSPDFALLIGDNIYADEVANTVAGYHAKYRQIFGGSQLRAMMAQVPVFMMWDDHEIINDYYPGKSDRFESAVVAYEHYQGSHNPAPLRGGERYYSFVAGSVGFFVLDTRTHRSPNDAPDDADKSMLGDTQRQDLLDWLSTSDARLKVIVSSVPFNDFGTTGPDSWAGFRTERAAIFEHVWGQAIEGVLLLSGDQHWSGAFRMTGDTPDQVLYELMPTPIGIYNRDAPTYENAAILARDDDHQVFGVFDVDPGAEPLRLDFTLCRAGVACAPGDEPPPGSSLNQPADMDNLPYGLRFELRDGQLALVTE